MISVQAYLFLKALGIAMLIGLCAGFFVVVATPGKKPFSAHPNRLFRFVATFVSAIAITGPILFGMPMYQVFIIGVLVNIVLQKIADHITINSSI
jgi:hypothetical protein